MGTAEQRNQNPAADTAFGGVVTGGTGRGPERALWARRRSGPRVPRNW